MQTEPWCEIYLLDVASLVADEAAMSCLSPYRQDKVRKFKHDGGRRLSLGAGLLLDYALRRHDMSEKAAEYTFGEHGKPHIEGVHFNLSHSGTMVACAVASCAVGIDIEKTSRRYSEALLRHVCCEAEQEQVRRDPSTFFDLWTAKEAVTKMTGTGIGVDLRNIDISKCTTWRLDEGYAMSLATEEKCNASIVHCTLSTIFADRND